MRIIGEIKHPSLKITVFKHNMRLSVKIENAHYEQSYKFPEDVITTLEDVERCLKEGGMLTSAEAIMGKMHNATLSALNVVSSEEDEVFEEII